MLDSQYENHKHRLPGAVKPLIALAVLTTMIVVLAVKSPSTAIAQPLSLTDLILEVQFMPEIQPGTNGLIVGARLPAGTTLPATVRLPLPEGANVFWAGEITGGPIEQNIQRDFTIVEGVGGQAVEFTVETTTAVQYDAMYGTVNIAGNVANTELVWRQTVDTGPIVFGIRLPPGTELVLPDAPTPPLMNPAGERLYALMPVELEPGVETTLAVAYRAAGDAAAGEGQSLVMYFLFSALAVALVGLGLAIFAQHKRR